jgi:ubiquinone/menaquinone biosynthesis C-methylase UbiE
VAERTVAEFYSEPGMEWSLRSVGTHLHPGGEEATVALADRAQAIGFPRGGVVLEVASALGGPARFLARRFGSRLVCVDMDRQMHLAATRANRAEGLGRVVQAVLARTERLPLRDASVDAAWSQDALCHMEKAKVLTEVARVLKPGSVFAFTDFVARGRLTADDLQALKQTWAFPSLFRLEEYVAALSAIGFDVEFVEDRTVAVLSDRPQRRPDDEAWWRAFTERWGADEARTRADASRLWQSLLVAGRAGYGMVLARKMAD